MAKRKGLRKPEGTQDDESSSDEDMEMINVDFEWFDPQPAVDFHGLKVLLRQLFDNDAQLFDLSALTDLILSQPLLGSTVKVGGNESDPYAFLTVLNLQQHKDVPVVKNLITYLRDKSTASQLSALRNLLSQPSIPSIGLLLTERLINIPPEVIPPMYSMLMEEISWALEEKEPYEFTHYLIISKTYEEVESKVDQEDDRPRKKKKARNENQEVFFFHPEDEVLQRHSLCYGAFQYTNQQPEGHSDSKRAFQDYGIRPQGHMMLIEAAILEAAVKDVADFIKPPS